MNPALQVDVRHRLGGFALQAQFGSDGGLTALFGPSGSGKTSLVNIIGGLIRPEHGRVVVDGQVLLDTQAGIDLPSHRRRIGYVFQEARLFPHLTVRQNLLFGRWFAPRLAPATTELDAVLELLGIGHLLARRPAGLSGGEKQRVAIGRALLAKPRLLLMDEPLASLDEARKAEILPHIERLRDELHIPIIYVSHAVAEVARLATTLAVMEQGRVVVAGPGAEVMTRLDIAGLSGLREAGSVLEGEVLAHDPHYGLTTLRSRAGLLQIPGPPRSHGARLRVRILARDVMLSLGRPQGLSALNILAGTVAEIGEGDGRGAVTLRIDCGGAPLLSRVTAKSVAELGLVPGLGIHAIVKSVSVEAP